jgi:acylpyruvate hydrolase
MKPRNIWAVGRNYLDHAKEMKADLPKAPLIFLKSGGCASFGDKVILPAWASEVHHEIELALKFDRQLEFSEFALALDLTERALQSEAKTKGLPWTTAKSFIGACPITPFKKINDLSALDAFSVELEINGTLKQKGFTKDFIFSIPVLREHLLRHFPVEEGDWLLTGTPAGVGPLKKGDTLIGRIPGQIEFNWTVE